MAPYCSPGESGTGKEMFVRAIHRLSRRKDCPLLACDCSALAPTLLESELFGHMKGSFSGAIATKQGLFEAAHQGTLFLDEVANLSMETQGKLLRVLETKRVKKVGDTAERDVDIRLISATNRELGEMVREGAFREDLYYRLNVVPIYLPPLRDRQGDIPRLAISFLERFCKKNQVDAEGVQLRGDVPDGKLRLAGQCPRTAEHRRAAGHSLRPGPHRAAASCPRKFARRRRDRSVSQLPHNWEEFKRLKQQVRDAAVEQLERRFLSEALQRCEGNVSRAAEEIGIQRTNLHALMRKYGLTFERRDLACPVTQPAER